MTFQELLDYIALKIADNTTRDITPEVDRDVRNALAQWVEDNKVAKVSGKGLSTEDYTTTEKTRLSNAIIKDFGIELEANGVAKLFDGDLDTLTETGPYRGGYNVTNKSPDSNSRDYYYVIKQSDDFIIQLAFTFSNNNVARRTRINGVWTSWISFLDTNDKTELLNKINKLSIGDLDLTDPAIWYPATKTLDLDGEQGGVLNFNSNPAAIQIENISSSSPAIITVPNASLIQEDSEVSPSAIQGGTEYTGLNGNNYLAKNVDYINNTFELYETNGTTPVDTTSTGVVTNITNLTVGNPTIVEVAGAAGLDEDDLVGISGTGTLLDGNRYNITNVNLGANTFDINEDTTGETWNSSGEVTQITYIEETGEIEFTNGLKLEVERIVNVDNGVRFKFSASENNEITFSRTSLSSAASGDIVGSGVLVLSGKSGIMEMLRLKNLNYMKTEFEAS